MRALAGQVLRWLVRYGISFVLILAVLVGWLLIQVELGNADKIQNERQRLVADVQLRNETLAGIERQADRARGAADEMRRALKFEEFELDHFRTSIDARIRAEEATRATIRRESPVAVLIPFTRAWEQDRYQEALIAGLKRFAGINDEAAQRLKADPRWQQIEGAVRAVQDIDARVARERRDVAALQARVAALTAEYDAMLVKKETYDNVFALVRGQVPLAATILLIAIVLPIGLKLTCYYAVAPLAARFPPIRLLPAASGRYSVPRPAAGDTGRISAVSVPIVLAPGTELLVRPEYLQSTATAAAKRTQWFLNARHPLSSLASGMFALTRVRPHGEQAIVVSSTQDPLSEVGVVELPEGSAVVCQPRALAGVVKAANRAVRISRHWRLGSLHAWLTFQLRFLVFHGPCTLVLKGCRGIRVEVAEPERMVNQAATLGFSANVAYANRRCETFVAYWTGAEDLFNDVFAGSPGFFIYEEMPSLRRKAGITGRGLEGVLDASLRVFGI